MAATVETIAQAYVAHAGGNAGRALREVIADALADLCEAERLISHGYVRGQLGEPMEPGLLAVEEVHAADEAAA
jgi:hypothetical protein